MYFLLGANLSPGQDISLSCGHPRKKKESLFGKKTFHVFWVGCKPVARSGHFSLMWTSSKEKRILVWLKDISCLFGGALTRRPAGKYGTAWTPEKAPRSIPFCLIHLFPAAPSGGPGGMIPPGRGGAAGLSPITLLPTARSARRRHPPGGRAETANGGGSVPPGRGLCLR